MCGPAAIPIMSAAAGAGSAYAAGAGAAGIVAAGAMSAASGMQAQSNIEAAEANVELAKSQQEQLEAEAQNVRIAGSQEAGEKWKETQRYAAAARAEAGAAGISGTTGTMGQVGESIIEAGNMEQMITLSNASREAWGLEVQGENLVEQAQAEKKAARQAGYATILSSAASGYLSGMSIAAA